MNDEMEKIFLAMQKDNFTTDEEAREYIETIFNGYCKRKRNGTLYSKDDLIPQIIIGAYYAYVDRLDINELFGNFKRRYIYNENQLEQVHEVKERQGLSKVYDYLQELKDLNNTNVYDMFKIHKILYSLVDCPEFGGSIRTSPAHIKNAPINLVSPEDITDSLQKLFIESKELAKRGILLSKDFDSIKLLKYIDDCVKLKCELVRIHPFADGNGRSARALLNLYFKLANIPPVYVKKAEKDEYQEAMAKAICDEEYNPDFTSINKFYYYKICDSLVQLDIEKKKGQKSI